MADSIPLQIAETIQTASIKRHPSPRHDLNPSTAASTKVPVQVSSQHSSHAHSHHLDYSDLDDDDDDDDEEEEDDEHAELDDLESAASHSSTSSIPSSTLIQPAPRSKGLPPLPDLRFEQSYLASIASAESRQAVAYITLRDQVVLPLMQGLVYSLATLGWRYWNANASLAGESMGSRVRRWWWRTNNWDLNPRGGRGRGAGLGSRKVASDVGEYYKFEQGAGGD